MSGSAAALLPVTRASAAKVRDADPLARRRRHTTISPTRSAANGAGENVPNARLAVEDRPLGSDPAANAPNDTRGAPPGASDRHVGCRNHEPASLVAHRTAKPVLERSRCGTRA